MEKPDWCLVQDAVHSPAGLGFTVETSDNTSDWQLGQRLSLHTAFLCLPHLRGSPCGSQ